MMGWEFAFDAAGDFYFDAEGELATTDRIDAEMYLQLYTDLEAWAGDPDAGSKLFELDNVKNSLGTAHRARDAVLAALSGLVDDGLARDLTIQIEQEGSRFRLEGELTDEQGSTTLLDALEVGV